MYLFYLLGFLCVPIPILNLTYLQFNYVSFFSNLSFFFQFCFWHVWFFFRLFLQRYVRTICHGESSSVPNERTPVCI